eukprot:jgi/Botrbrau1/14363/Bobra.0014s0018.1
MQEPRMRKREDDEFDREGGGVQHQASDDADVVRESTSDEDRDSPTYRFILEEAWRTGADSVELPTNLIMLFQLTMVTPAMEGGLGRVATMDQANNETVCETRTSKGRHGGGLAPIHVAEQTEVVGSLNQCSRGPHLCGSVLGPGDLAGDLSENSEGAKNIGRRRISLDRLKVTTIQSFRRALQLAVAYKRPLAAQGMTDPVDVPFLDEGQLDSLSLQENLQGTVIILPRIVTQVYSLFGPFLSIDSAVKAIINFVTLTGATTIPSLEEYSVLPNKMDLSVMYEKYHQEDPENRRGPIPTAFFPAPGTMMALTELFYLKLYHAEALEELSLSRTDVIMQNIWNSFRTVEDLISRSSTRREALQKIRVTSRNRVEGGDAEEVLMHYIIKREHSEGSMHMKRVAFPVSALRLGRTLAESKLRNNRPWRARPALPERLAKALDYEVTACQEGLLDPEFCADPAGDSGPQLPYESVPYLQEAAEFVLLNSCGEGFLVQPEIVDMSNSEYRVYLFGGASAEGNENDTVVVYTPATVEYENTTSQIFMTPYTLPYGSFMSYLRIPIKKERDAFADWDEFLHWPEMHQLIINTALDGARAIAKYGGDKMRTVSKMYARVDVVMIPLPQAAPDAEPVPGIDSENPLHYYFPLINEMDWINSASVMYSGWEANLPEGDPQPASQEEAEVAKKSSVQSSPGTRLASHLREEIFSTVARSASE